MLGEHWDRFEAFEFLVLTANFTSLRDQTMERLREHGLLPSSRSEQKRVVFSYIASADNLESCAAPLHVSDE